MNRWRVLASALMLAASSGIPVASFMPDRTIPVVRRERADPKRMAAAEALKSMTYSRANAACLSVSPFPLGILFRCGL